jgi:Leucine-rich repeat (LRR) protein
MCKKKIIFIRSDRTFFAKLNTWNKNIYSFKFSYQQKKKQAQFCYEITEFSEDHVHVGLFEGLTSLATLIVDNFGSLEAFDRHTFAHLGASLHTVSVTHCSVARIADGCFDQLTRLTRLDLEANKLTSFTCPLVGPLAASLHSLNLTGNRIETVSGLFGQVGGSPSPSSSLPKLKYLNLSGNALFSLPARSFASLSALRSLDLSCNRLTHLSGDALAGLFTLQDLDLSSNPFDEISTGLFRDLASLKTLDLNFLQLRKLDERAFHHFRTPRLTVKISSRSRDDLCFFILSNIKNVSLVLTFEQTPR